MIKVKFVAGKNRIAEKMTIKASQLYFLHSHTPCFMGIYYDNRKIKSSNTSVADM